MPCSDESQGTISMPCTCSSRGSFLTCLQALFQALSAFGTLVFPLSCRANAISVQKSPYHLHTPPTAHCAMVVSNGHQKLVDLRCRSILHIVSVWAACIMHTFAMPR